MIRLCTKIDLSMGPVSQDGRAERREDFAVGGGGGRDGGETDLSHYALCLCQITQETSQTHMQLLGA